MWQNDCQKRFSHFCILDLEKKISHRQLRSVARELIPFWHFEPVRVDPN